MLFLGLLLLLFAVQTTYAAAPKNQEFCQWEVFEAECPSDHVIVIDYARYGRMQYGRCIKRDYGYVGCDVDVRDLADMRCSGKRSCKITVPDPLLDGTRPCPEDLKLYLEANYTCVKVVTPNKTRCHSSIQSAKPSGILASDVTQRTGCGSPNAPWLLKVLPGQRINLTMLDFGRIQNDIESGGKTTLTHCQVYAVIKEKGSAKSATICGGTTNRTRERSIYVSEGHELEVRIVTNQRTRGGAQFLIKYESTRCPDLPLGPNAWWERDGDHAVFGCKGNSRTWRITCSDGTWNGHVGNCTDNSSGFHVSVQGLTSMTRASSLLIVLGIAVCIGLIILVVGLLILKRKTWRNQNNQPPQGKIRGGAPFQQPLKQVDADFYMSRHMAPRYPSPPLMYRPDSYSPEENEYAYVEEFHFPSTNSCGDGTPTTQTDPRMMMQSGPYGFYGDQNTVETMATQDKVGAHGSGSDTASNPRSQKYTYYTLDPNTVKESDSNANMPV